MREADTLGANALRGASLGVRGPERRERATEGQTHERRGQRQHVAADQVDRHQRYNGGDEAGEQVSPANVSNVASIEVDGRAATPAADSRKLII